MNINPYVIIYILCYDDDKLKLAKQIYGKYYWARPTLMKYQDNSFENAFWSQLMENKPEWEEAEMVGVLSWKAYLKIDIENVNKIITGKLYKSPYHHFYDIRKKYLDDPHVKNNKYLKSAINEVSADLHIKLPEIIQCSNYFMCKPEYMTGFVKWHKTSLLPALLLNHNSYGNANYKGAINTPAECFKRWGLPYYPVLPFALERLNPCYFLPSNKLHKTPQE